MSLELARRRMMMAMESIPSDAIIVAKRSDNEAALMEVIYAQGWSQSPEYMTKSEAEQVKVIPSGCFQTNLGITDFSAFQFFGVSQIGDYAFRYCTNLITIYFPPTLTKMESSSSTGRFAYCSSLRNVNIEQIELMENGNEFRNTALEIVTLNDNLPSVPPSCFYNCNNIDSIIIPNSVKTIGGSAFRRCKSLSKVVIGAGVESIGVQAFEKISGQEKMTVTIYAITPPTIQSNTFTSAFVSYIYVPDESVEAYKAVDVWSTFADRIKPLSEYIE